MQKEIGGYFELEQYSMDMLYEDGVLLNCGRNCLAYIIQAKGIKKILLPKLNCDSVANICRRESVDYCYYRIQKNWLPEEIEVSKDEWLYIVNYYGQINNNQIEELKKQYKNIIVDNTQAYFQPPVKGVDTIYTCRKYFGVSDGAVLFTDTMIDTTLEVDKSMERMKFVLGRYEGNAPDYYQLAHNNNIDFDREPIKTMSKITRNILHSIDYQKNKKIRFNNYLILDRELSSVNKLRLEKVEGPFAYPLLVENGNKLRKKLVEQKVYVSTLWEETLKICNDDELEYFYANNIIPLPIDQRYDQSDMEYIVSLIKDYI